MGGTQAAAGRSVNAAGCRADRCAEGPGGTTGAHGQVRTEQGAENPETVSRGWAEWLCVPERLKEALVDFLIKSPFYVTV